MSSRTLKILQLAQKQNRTSYNEENEQNLPNIASSLQHEALYTDELLVDSAIFDDILILPLDGEIQPASAPIIVFGNGEVDNLQRQFISQDNSSQQLEQLEALLTQNPNKETENSTKDKGKNTERTESVSEYESIEETESASEDESTEETESVSGDKRTEDSRAISGENEEEDPNYESDISNNPELSNDTDEIESPQKAKRQRKRKSDKATWNCNENKYKRMKGLPYKGRGKSQGGKAVFNRPRPARKLLPPCNCKQSLKGKTLKCRRFSLEDRQQIYNNFWENLNWQERKQYVKGLVDVLPTAARKSDKGSSRRSVTLLLKLKNNGTSLRVCKKMFLNTLAIKEWSLLHWANPKQTQSDNEDANIEKPKPNQRNFEARNVVHKFFGELPKMESHYCRARTNRLYLEPIWQSKADLYREYLEFSKRLETQNTVSIKTFAAVFEELNLSLFIPKKDQCDVCTDFRAKNLSQEDYEQHQKNKINARQEKEKDKAEAEHVYCMDLQKVLLSPHSNVSSLYYKRKLCVHNFTIYNLKNHDGFCYIWHEGEGDITAQEFASVVCNFILSQKIDEGKEVILYSDNCSYQNKNVFLSNALLNLALDKNITITQKFLEKGHTQMEVDSMHACIERRLKNREINVPAEYANHCRKARKSPKPYDVQYLDHTFFRNYSKVNFLSSIRPGTRTGEAVVNDIKAITFKPSKEIYFKLNHTDDWSLLNRRFNKNVEPVPNGSLPSLYSEPRPITKDKYKNLQELKTTLLADFHSFYDQLKFK